MLALLLGPSIGLAPSGPLRAAFKSAPGRFVAHPGRVLNVRSRGFTEGHPCPSPEATFGCSNSFLTNLSLRRRLDATRMILCISHNKKTTFFLCEGSRTSVVNWANLSLLYLSGR
ncbi:hypothetical protein R583_11620 [Salmonella enterica subsp. enterica serovar Senftenberg]|nr:hypothetical protein R535_15395 [Salmonella enterica subsp. enterica serovar Holcomb]OSF21007.1 hypothetical protein R583_11620 [Salmonella enterica subsp. enterica serovar Senftenberg]OSF65864.1 hypothetical protein R572_10420 [Salmonella enterica subsp. enterica serovar Newport]OSF74157.1 hypothetical protein R570_15065 [Salmonella enterica subsp. enterica serovar Infantis]PEH20995.1 hypothetical protein CBI74_08585 [Salmonella enterica]